MDACRPGVVADHWRPLPAWAVCQPQPHAPQANGSAPRALVAYGLHFLSVYFFSVYIRPNPGIRRPDLQFLEPARVSFLIIYQSLSLPIVSLAVVARADHKPHPRDHLGPCGPPSLLQVHTFSAFWLRSSVVSVLISLISDISTTVDTILN
jgi:hypothetical protein